jgi:hypothetical protein
MRVCVRVHVRVREYGRKRERDRGIVRESKGDPFRSSILLFVARITINSRPGHAFGLQHFVSIGFTILIIMDCRSNYPPEIFNPGG